LCCIIHAMLRKQEEFKDFIILWLGKGDLDVYNDPWDL
jgi:hypothetical protein